MWTANAATVSPSVDTHDRKVHFTTANLTSMFHRSIEPSFSFEVLRKTFSDENLFVHHQALPSCASLGDEGAANHTRFCESYGHQGVELFVFGRYGFKRDQPKPQVFPARQTYEA